MRHIPIPFRLVLEESTVKQPANQAVDSEVPRLMGLEKVRLVPICSENAECFMCEPMRNQSCYNGKKKKKKGRSLTPKDFPVKLLSSEGERGRGTENTMTIG